MAKNVAVREPAERSLYGERTSRREELRRRVQNLKEKNGAVSSDAHSKRLLAEEAAREVSRFVKPIIENNERRGKSKDYMDPWQNEQLGKLKRASAAAEEAATIAEQGKKFIVQEIDKLENELENFGHLLGIADVLQYQGDITKAEKKVAEFRNLIAEQEGVIKKADKAAPYSVDGLLQKREDLLADIALGTATDKDLKALDEQIEVQAKALDAFNKVTANARQLIAGLQRKLDTAEDDLKLLQSKREDVITECLMGQAEMIGEEYVELSMKLIDTFKQLVAMDQIMGYPSRLIGHGSDTFAIPTFKLKAFAGLEQNSSYGQMYAARAVAGPFKDASVIRAAVEEVKKQFAEAGVNL